MGNFDDRVASFQRLGLSEAAARIAATGRRRHEADVRREMDTGQPPTRLGESGRGGLASREPLPSVLAEAIDEVSAAAREVFGKSEDQARIYALQLAERALDRCGDATAAASHLRTARIAIREVYRPQGAR
jgi:hypothetical protein